MFASIQPTILDWITTTRLFLTGASSLTAPRAVRTAKGLAFVQLYAVYEYTVRESVDSAFVIATGHAMPTSKLLRGMMAIALDSEFTALSDLGRRRSWKTRLQLIDTTAADKPAVFTGKEFPNDGSHYRPNQLETIWTILGISKPIVSEPRHRGRINELVEHRNAIAHGRESADKIGRRFSTADIQDRIDDVQQICLYVLQTIEDHCSIPANFCRSQPAPQA